MTLHREPTDLERPIIKAIDDLMTEGAETLNGDLLALRSELIDQAVDELQDLEPADYHTLTVQPTDDDREEVLGFLTSLFLAGAKLIISELNLQGGSFSGPNTVAPDEDDRASLRGLADLTTARIANDVQARAITSAIGARTLGLDVEETVRGDFAQGSTGYVRRAAGEATNATLAAGRDAEIATLYNEIGQIIYSAVLDKNTCGPCDEDDGDTGTLETVTPVPNPRCKGGASCRCIHIAVLAGPDLPPIVPTPSPAPAATPPASASPATGAAARETLAQVKASFEAEQARLINKRIPLIDRLYRATDNQERSRVQAELRAVDQALQAARDARRQGIEAVIYQPERAEFKYEGLNLSGRERTAVAEGLDAFKRLIGPGKISGKIIIRGGGRRAYYNLDGLIEISRSSPGRTVVHELGHWLEDLNPGIKKAVFDFYERRTAGEIPQKMNDLLPVGYGDHELTLVDKFFHPYVGLIYKTPKGERIATEVLSMGLESMFAEPFELMEKDPEFFDFIYELVRK